MTLHNVFQNLHASVRRPERKFMHLSGYRTQRKTTRFGFGPYRTRFWLLVAQPKQISNHDAPRSRFNRLRPSVGLRLKLPDSDAICSSHIGSTAHRRRRCRSVGHGQSSCLSESNNSPKFLAKVPIWRSRRRLTTDAVGIMFVEWR